MAFIVCELDRLGGWNSTARVVDTLEAANTYLWWLSALYQWKNRQPWNGIDYPGDCPVVSTPLFIGMSSDDQADAVEGYISIATEFSGGSIFQIS